VGLYINMRFNIHKSMVSVSENPSLLERNVSRPNGASSMILRKTGKTCLH